MHILQEVKCFHCGQPCEEEIIASDDKVFCCYGCKVIYEIINANDLCEYYHVQDHPGINGKSIDHQAYAYLDEESVRKEMLMFDSGDLCRVQFSIPAMHCSSCIWLLENLQRIDPGILRSEANFGRKTVTVDFNPRKVKLGVIAAALDSLGYAPYITLEGEKPHPKTNVSPLLRLGVAGFCFGNVMLFSFPEYLGLDKSDETLGRIFSWLNLALAVPVLVYSAADYFRSSLKSFRQRQINIDVPIALGLLALFFRSTWDIGTGHGPGYLDSFTGLVFFLLIGRWFQSRTYENLAFDRDFKSYFPLAVQRFQSGAWRAVVIFELRKGDRIKVRNQEVIPADATLEDDKVLVDYSFVTGEARPVEVGQGEKVYAGGRLIGTPAEFVIVREVSQSHLTSLWNNEAFRKKRESGYQKVIDRVAQKFTWIVLLLALITALIWYQIDPPAMWLVLTSVLMVACPCALALAAPFTYGSMLRVFGRHQFYLKNADVIERLSAVDAVVFDKTGTLTHGREPVVVFDGELSAKEFQAVKTIAGCSTHPLSNLVHASIKQESGAPVQHFREIPGKGVEGEVSGSMYRLGSASFVGVSGTNETRVYITVDDTVRGYFSIRAVIRNNLKDMFLRLAQKCVAMVSGDGDGDRSRMRSLFPAGVRLLFHQQPQDKMKYIRGLQDMGRNVMMIGDGLNDAGALKQADVGVAVTDDTGLFTPACDGILQGEQLKHLDKFISLARASSVILKTAFAISIFYNGVALSFAVTGNLTPLVAAILMPVSSISVVGFSSLAVRFTEQKTFRKTGQKS